MNKLTCPVCDKSQIEGSICPNCETNLSTYGMLVSLPLYTPVEEEKKKPIISIWLPISMAILLLILGLGMGLASNFLMAQHQPNHYQSNTNMTSSFSFDRTKKSNLSAPMIVDLSSNVIESQPISCPGFNYTVRRGDSLSLIAARFYGDSNLWSLISEANSTIKGRESWIEINEVLLIPNLRSTCLNY